MLSIQRILWPTDFSTGAEHAFPYAAALAQWHEAELHLLNVREGDEAARTDMTAKFPVSTDALAPLLEGEEEASAVDLSALALVQEQVDAPSPADAIVSYAEEQDVDLVVAGTHGRRGLQRLLIGSVAEELVRRAPCPVLAVRADEEGASAWNVHNILVPIDFSSQSDRAVRHARELALTYGAQVTLLHAVEEVIYPSAYGLETADAPSPEVVERVESSLASIAREEIGHEHVVVDAVVGYAPSVILDYQQEHNIDLTVISTHGRSGLERLLLGSVTERVLRRTTSPVFVVKSFGKSLLPATPEPAST
jgi:nucleotide-binding universal stress UspA family protein